MTTEPDFSPRADGMEQAIRAGRRRRAQRQFGGAGAAALVAVFALLVTLHPFAGTAASDSIRVATDPTSSAEETPGPGEPSAEPTDETDPPEPTPSASPTDSEHGGVSEAGGPYQHPQEPGDAEPTEDPTEDSDRVSPQPEHSTVAYSSSSDCAQDPIAVPGQTTMWCLVYSGDTTVKRGGIATVSADLCRLPNQGAGTWTFNDQDGMAFQVEGGTTEWSSQDGRKVNQEDWTVSVDAGTCLRFTTTWDTRDRDGFRVRPGDYYVDFQVSGSSETGGYTSSSSATLTVTD